MKQVPQYFFLLVSTFTHLEDLESARKGWAFGASQSEEEVQQCFSVVLLKHDLLVSLRRFRRRRRSFRRFSLFPRVLDQTLSAPQEARLRLEQSTHMRWIWADRRNMLIESIYITKV